jgi:hypothetical protein
MFAHLDEAKTPAEMRASIERGQRLIPIVRQALMTARGAGLSAEDTYSMLAYHALQHMQELARVVLELQKGEAIPVLLDVIDAGGQKLDGQQIPYKSESAVALAASTENGQRGSEANA